jgi:hemerythrin
MSEVVWNIHYELGIEDIDNQHKGLVIGLNKIYHAYKREGELNVPLMILELYDYVHTHFKTEEQYMEYYKYPDAEAHIKEHRL